MKAKHLYLLSESCLQILLQVGEIEIQEQGCNLIYYNYNKYSGLAYPHCSVQEYLFSKLKKNIHDTIIEKNITHIRHLTIVTLRYLTIVTL